MTTWQTHPQFLGLYRAICDHPFDATPRGILYDWLVDHAPEQADFMLAQATLADLLKEPPTNQLMEPDYALQLARYSQQEQAGYAKLVTGSLWIPDACTRQLHGRPFLISPGMSLQRPQRHLTDLRYPSGDDWPKHQQSWPWYSCGPTGGQCQRSFKLERGMVSTVAMSQQGWLTFGPMIVRECPITLVILIGKNPYVETRSPPLVIWYERESGEPNTIDPPYGIHPAIMRHMRHHAHPVSGSVRPGEFPFFAELSSNGRVRSPAAANALSDACIAHARAIAGMPPL